VRGRLDLTIKVFANFLAGDAPCLSIDTAAACMRRQTRALFGSSEMFASKKARGADGET